MNKEELKNMFSKSDQTVETIEEADKVISRIAKEYLGLDTYPNQFEIVTSEQMLDAYSLIGLPLSYSHQKFGKDFVINSNQYKKGQMGLAYELVINSSPCISYNMEENTTCLMILVLAHAAYGHNHFFKNNYLFKQFTHADHIIDYMQFAKNYISECEEKYGLEEVELTLDACHALMNYGVDKYKKPVKLSPLEERERFKQKVEDDRILENVIWKTIPKQEEKKESVKNFPETPEENILYFLEKNAPYLKEQQREIVRIVRKISQYFYPQGMTKVLNEGCATFSHYEIINKMWEEGYLTDGFMLEFLHNHSNVIFQPGFDSKYYSGINPYTLGFNILKDIKRMSLEPTDEDYKQFPTIAGNQDQPKTFRQICENFKDDTFVLQFLSPKVIRDMKLFVLDDRLDSTHYEISSIHNDEGYERVRQALSEQYNRNSIIPDIQVYNVNFYDNRRLTLMYTHVDKKLLDSKTADKVIRYVKYLQKFPVDIIDKWGKVLISID